MDPAQRLLLKSLDVYSAFLPSRTDLTWLFVRQGKRVEAKESLDIITSLTANFTDVIGDNTKELAEAIQKM